MEDAAVRNVEGYPYDESLKNVVTEEEVAAFEESYASQGE